MLMVAENELVMPNKFVDVTNEEMEYDSGGIGLQAVLAIFGAAIVAGGATYGAGQVAGERAYHAGLRKAKYNKIKWGVRVGVIGLTSPIFGGILITGFENKFYSMH